jgi:hypothetical protein
MKKSVARILFLATAMFGQRVMAQSGVVEKPPVEAATSAESTPAPAEAAPAVEAAPAPAPVATDPALAAKVADLEAKLKKVEAAEAANQAKADNFSKLKLSGYVQGRYEYHQDANNGWSFPAPGATGTGSTGAKDYFYVKRARLITVYNDTNAEMVVQIDASGTSFAAKDLEAAFIDTWTPLHLRISVGQFKYPFGYELQQSDVVREMPERSRFILNYFPASATVASRSKESTTSFASRLPSSMATARRIRHSEPWIPTTTRTSLGVWASIKASSRVAFRVGMATTISTPPTRTRPSG